MVSGGIKLLIGAVIVGAVFIGVRQMAIGQAMRRQPIPAPNVDEGHSMGHNETAVLAGGCFWGVQSVYNRVKGVEHTTAGYAGGSASTATYEQVSSYGTILRIFFSVVHDPTQLNRQGPDVGTSYRSVIFYTNEEQRKIAEDYIAQLDAAHVFPSKIVTQVVPLKAFYNGESYHQDYADKNPNNPYIQVCDVPKMAALKVQFPDLFQEYHGH
jgi:peptide-methionine (S)-S-oxide reductase